MILIPNGILTLFTLSTVDCSKTDPHITSRVHASKRGVNMDAFVLFYQFFMIAVMSVPPLTLLAAILWYVKRARAYKPLQDNMAKP